MKHKQRLVRSHKYNRKGFVFFHDMTYYKISNQVVTTSNNIPSIKPSIENDGISSIVTYNQVFPILIHLSTITELFSIVKYRNQT